MNEYFQQQIASGATDQFFYGTEIDGTVRIERHRGSLDTFPQELAFIRMMGSTPFFNPAEVEEVRPK